jgi:uncharacterized membrane protein
MEIKGRILLVWNELRFSYWFVPALMALAAIALSVGTVSIDRNLGSDALGNAAWLFANRPDGARALLSTIAGSMITVAGVTFSITIAAVASSTNQFGPRLLTNFLSDRGNQLTLGTFIATFLYCLLVLRSVVGAEEADQAFVPHLAVLFGLVLALASVGVLIFYLHHVPQSVHVSHMIAGVGYALLDEIDRVYPQRIGEPADQPEAAVDLDTLQRRFAGATPVPAAGAGYVQQIDGQQLMKTAAERDLILRIECRPGAFVRPDRPLALVLADPPPEDDVIDRLGSAFTWDVKRSPTQDIMFLVDQLVEIAARALSPGLNDPFTAMNCVEWLTTALAKVAGRELPSPCRFDPDGNLRVVAWPIDFPEMAEAAFGALRPYICADRNAAIHAIRSLGSLAEDLRTDEQRDAILSQAAAYLADCKRSLQHAADKAEVVALHAAVRERCAAAAG